MWTFGPVRDFAFLALVILTGALGACRVHEGDLVRIGGSSTVYPISEAAAEELGAGNRIRITIASTGTGGGFKKFCDGALDITGASRPIKSTEVERCAGNGVGWIELPIAYDGIVIAVNPENDWVDTMTVAELQRLWQPEAQNTIMRWNQIRPEWPDEVIRLYGAGTDSGTYDYFTAAIVGTEHSSRGDYLSSEDDNVIVQGVARDRYALGFFGFAYYSENTDSLKAIGIDPDEAGTGAEPVWPSVATVQDGTYQPLSRPLLVYVRSDAADAPTVDEMMRFYIENAAWISEDVGYIGLPERATALVMSRYERRVTGSVFSGGSRVGVTVDELLASEGSGHE